MFETGPLYDANLNCEADVITNQGGTSSSKTYSILQVLFTIAVSTSDLVITVAGQSIPNLKSGALRDARSIYNNSSELKQLVEFYNKSERTFTFKNGSIMEFESYVDAQDAKSGKRDYLFVNEANGISYAIFTELHLRTRLKTFIDYNPNEEFWVHENIIGKPNSALFISDHRHNPFLTDKVREKIEGLKDIDEELWKVYARGLTGKIQGLIFRHYNIVPEIPKDAKLISHGLDFGFTNDPTAVPGVWMQDGQLWIREFIYETNMTNQDIAARCKSLGITQVIADSAEPKSIQELSNAGIYAEPAKKGADSVKASIDLLKQYKLNITHDSYNLIKELRSYKWRVDKVSGKSMNEPVDFNNHLIDAIRYVALNRINKNIGHYRIR